MKLAYWLCLCAAIAVFAGCTPKVPVDTDGDRRPDAEMTWDQLESWRAQDAARTKAEAKRVQRDAERAIKLTDSAKSDEIEQIKAEAEDAVDDLTIEYQAREDSRQSAIASLQAQQDMVNGILSDPAVKGVVGGLPYGNTILSLGGLVLGGIFGHSRGKAKGKDEGWQEREDYQAKIDATWEEGNSRAVAK